MALDSPHALLGPSDIQTREQLQAEELQRVPSGSSALRQRASAADQPATGEQSLQSLPSVSSTDYARYRHTAPLRRWWNRHIAVATRIQHRRDHLALERTYLGYVRTSVAFSMLGVVIAQLFRLQHSINPNVELGFFKVGVPLAVIFIVTAIVITVLGAVRFWRQQNAMLRGKVWAGGWDVISIMTLSILLCVALFVLILAIDIKKGYN